MFKLAICLLFSFIIIENSIAQTILTIATGAELTPSCESGPIHKRYSLNSYPYNEFAYLYTADELMTIPPGSLINSIAWYKTTTGASTQPGKLKIYLKNSGRTFYSNTFFSLLVNGATLAYSNDSTYIPADTGYIHFPTTAFVYTGGSLEVIISWDMSPNSGNSSTSGFNWKRNSVNAKILGYVDRIPNTDYLSDAITLDGRPEDTRPAIQIKYTGNFPPCTTPPAGGSITSSADIFCRDSLFYLKVSGGSSRQSGLVFQWQSSTDSVSWANFGLPTDDSVITSLNTNTYYRRIVTCGGSTDTSTIKLVKLKPYLECFCFDYANCPDDYIKNVRFGPLNNNSTCTQGGYVYYADSLNAPLIYKNSVVPVNIEAYIAPFTGIHRVGVWIDYNHNGAFENSEYKAMGYRSYDSPADTLDNRISIPSNAVSGITKMRVRLWYGSSTPSSQDSNACKNSSSGETEDYLVRIVDRISCTGTPEPGSTIADAEVCIDDPVILNVSTDSLVYSDLAYQWQISTDGITWADITGQVYAGASVYQDSTHFYRRRTSCGNNAVYSGAAKVSSKKCYCRPAISYCHSGDIITKVEFGSLSNSSGCIYGGYGDYTSTVPAPVIMVDSFTIAVTTGGAHTEQVSAWIDYNHNTLFDSTEYIFIGPSNGGTIHKIIGVPANALTGVTRIRIRLQATNKLDSNAACNRFLLGETEDYLIKFVRPCSGTPATDTAFTYIVGACSDSLYVFTKGTDVNSTGYTYQWQVSADSISWSDVAGQTSGSLQVLQDSIRFYRRKISCGAFFTYSLPVKVKSLCYCIPAASNCTGSYISRATFAGVNSLSGCAVNGYQFNQAYLQSSVPANSFMPITIETSCNSTQTNYTAAWIDFDQNGIFDHNEFTFIDTGCGIVSNNISIPGNALSGTTILRIRSTTDASITSADACTNYLSGETEDYTISISPYTCSITTWTGNAGTNNWEDAANWSCEQVPSTHSIVVINSGNVVIHSNITVYSLTVNPAANVTVMPPNNLTVTH